jgi:hypothetical protein
MSIPSQAEYERRERMMAIAKEQEVEQALLADRKEAQRSFFEVMRDDPALVAVRIGWLFNGNHGYGPMQLAKQLIASPRMNRRAGLVQLIGVYEWQVPRRMTIEAWKKLTAAQKKQLDAAVDVVIEAAEGEAE